MPLLVMKFGGTSVANLERIAHVADIVAARRAETRAIAVVVSAMSGCLISVLSMLSPEPSDFCG